MKSMLTKIQSKSGNKYRYDNATGLIFHDSISDLEKYRMFFEPVDFQFLDSLREEDIKEYLFNSGNGFNQLLLEMTSNCNMRCKYCIYSDHYFYSKDYSNNLLSLDTAIAAVDLYFENFKKVFFHNPHKKAAIGFYGGEPLLNFKVIQQLVEYCKNNYSHKYPTQFNITTNGLLLTDEVIDFLVENNFAITVSIDGNAENHNRNRVDVSGNATHHRVLQAIKSIQNRYPDYPLLGISACFDWKSDLKKMAEFFDENHLFVSKLAPIEVNNTNYYEQFTPEDQKRIEAQLNDLKSEFVTKQLNGTLRKDSFLYAFIGIMYAELFIHPVMAERKPWFAPVTSTCVPGEKMYVDTAGIIHICEKINPHHSIGDVHRGIDYSKIKQIIISYFNVAKQRGCNKCSMQRYCNNCYAQVATDTGFAITPGNCNCQRENALDLLEESINLFELDPALLEGITVDYYNKIFKKVGEINGEIL